MDSEHYHILEPIARGLHHNDLYVEVGCSNGETFKRIAPLFRRAIGLDIRNDLAEYIEPYGEYLGGITSDQFFAEVAIALPPIDFLWLDADHRYEYSMRDFTNAVPLIRELTGILAMHDSFPPDETMIRGGCWDSWKTAVLARDFPDLEVLTLPCGYGITMARRIPNGRHLEWLE